MQIPKVCDSRDRIAENVHLYKFDAKTDKLEYLGVYDILECDEWYSKKAEARRVYDERLYDTDAKTVCNKEGEALFHLSRYCTIWIKEHDDNKAMECVKREFKTYALAKIDEYQKKLYKIKEDFAKFLV